MLKIRGNIEQKSLLIELFTKIFAETQELYQTRNKIFFSAFSTEQSDNKFLDLILGERYTFQSKKSIDSYKSFFEKEITDMKEFFYTLKIATTRYQECSGNNDNLAFKIIVQTMD